jgi:hypothetical protein
MDSSHVRTKLISIYVYHLHSAFYIFAYRDLYSDGVMPASLEPRLPVIRHYMKSTTSTSYVVLLRWPPNNENRSRGRKV